MGDYPDTEREMLRANYKKLRVALCQSCQAQLQWWQTTHGRKMPFNLPDAKGVYTLHHCPNRPARVEPTPAENVTKRLGFIRMTQHARAIVMIDKDFGIHAVWAKGIPGEDLRTDLISAANLSAPKCRRRATDASHLSPRWHPCLGARHVQKG